VAKGSLTSLSCNFASNGYSTTSSYVLGPGGEQVTEYAVSGGASSWLHTNVFAAGQLLATYRDTNTYFALNDWLGTKRVEVAAGAPISCASAFASLPFGNGFNSAALPGYTACTDATEHHFTGKERDAESGNDYFPARYYAASTGRWLSPDPGWVKAANAADPQSWNLYAYVQNRPLVLADPDGMRPPTFTCTQDSLHIKIDGQDGGTIKGPLYNCQWLAEGGDLMGENYYLWAHLKAIGLNTIQQSPTKKAPNNGPQKPSFWSCTFTGNVGASWGETALDAVGIIPFGGNGVKGVQLASGIVAGSISAYKHSMTGAGLSAGGLVLFCG